MQCWKTLHKLTLNLDEIETELRALEAEETELERRTAILNTVPTATTVPVPVAEQRAQGAEVFDSVEYRKCIHAICNEQYTNSC